MKIEKLSSNSVDQLRELAILSYVEAYKNQLSAEEIQTRIDNKHSKSAFENLLKSDNHFFWGMFNAEQLLAYIEVSTDGKSETVDTADHLQLCRIYVHPAHKGLGLGKHLMQKAEGFAISRKLKGIWLHCFDQNTEAINFYQKGGFKLCGKDPFSIIPNLVRFDLVLMKDLSA